MVRPRKPVRESEGAAAGLRPPHPVPARRCRTGRRPAGRRTGYPPPRSDARTAFPRRDRWAGSDPWKAGEG